MLSENIKTFRRAKGLSQSELAVRLNVVRQTVSKWETGLSVPDADLLLALSEALDTPVSVLLGETAAAPDADALCAIAGKLEVINLQLARRRETGRRVWRALFVSLLVLSAAVLAGLAALGSPYLTWDWSDPETAVLGTAFHLFEWLFVRAAPFLLAGAAAGIALTRRKA